MNESSGIASASNASASNASALNAPKASTSNASVPKLSEIIKSPKDYSNLYTKRRKNWKTIPLKANEFPNTYPIVYVKILPFVKTGQNGQNNETNNETEYDTYIKLNYYDTSETPAGTVYRFLSDLKTVITRKETFDKLCAENNVVVEVLQLSEMIPKIKRSPEYYPDLIHTLNDEWTYSSVNPSEFPKEYQTIYVKLYVNKCIKLTYHRTSENVYQFLSDTSIFQIPKETFDKLCAMNMVVVADPIECIITMYEYNYAGRVVQLESTPKIKDSNRITMAFNPDRKIIDINTEVFNYFIMNHRERRIFFDQKIYKVLVRIGNKNCDSYKTLYDYKLTKNHNEIKIMIFNHKNIPDEYKSFIFDFDAQPFLIRRHELNFIQRRVRVIPGGRTKKSRRTHHKKRSFKRKLRKTHRKTRR